LDKKLRAYASFFEWEDRQRAELGVVEELLETLAGRSERLLSQPQSYKPDPPDCVCRNESGQLVAIEVTEIVCSEAARLNEQGHYVFRNWQPGELAKHIAAQLERKDGKTYHGGPYAEVIVCLFTDETLLTSDRIKRELVDATFGPFRQITGAYVLVSYDPSVKSYPVQTLRLVRSS